MPETNLTFTISPHRYEPGTVFEDAVCHGAYFEVGSEATVEWFAAYELQGNGYTVLALLDSLSRTQLKADRKKYAMEAEADNAWVYGQDQEAIERFIAAFKAATSTEAGVLELMKKASKKLLE